MTVSPPESPSEHARHASDIDHSTIAATAAEVLAQRTGHPRHDVAVVLGSGWRPAADVLCQPSQSSQSSQSTPASQSSGYVEIPMAELPGFLPPTAQGHGGVIRSLEISGRRVLIFLGRTHAYEGHELWRTVHAVRTAAAAGVTTVVLTNAAGGLAEGMSVGEPVLISDHLNMTMRSPLVGAEFVNMVDAYSPRLREVVHTLRPGIREAVYAMMPGPQYETPAEISMLRTLGAGVVGMSTVYETIAARAAGMEVVGISLVTNLAAGVTGEPLNHEEVLAAGAAAAEDMGGLLAEAVGAL